MLAASQSKKKKKKIKLRIELVDIALKGLDHVFSGNCAKVCDVLALNAHIRVSRMQMAGPTETVLSKEGSSLLS